MTASPTAKPTEARGTAGDRQSENKTELSPTANWTPPPLRPHAVPMMTASPTVILTEARGTDTERQLGDKIKLPHTISALPSPLHPTDLTTHTAIRQHAVNCYRNLYSRFRPQPPICRASG